MPTTPATGRTQPTKGVEDHSLRTGDHSGPDDLRSAANDLGTALSLTGERTLPGIWHENYWFRRHEAAYRWVTRTVASVRGGVAVDAGTGEGYGAQLLMRAGAAVVVAVDLDGRSLRHAAATYPGLAPVLANLVSLPLGTGEADVVVAAQVVEHLWDQPTFVRECARVLRPGGRLVLTTPNRRTFPPGNPFHSRELDAAELRALAAPHVAVDQLVGLHHGPALRAADARHDGLVGAQLATSHDHWPAELRADVAAVSADDFTVDAVDAVDDCLDLLLVGTRR